MAFKQFTKWLAEEETLYLPGNLMSRRFSFAVRAQVVKAFSAEQVKELLAACESERTRLYLLLMLNCGMYQVDVADLAQDEVDWTAGTIKRKRSKHRRRTGQAIPCVTYKLWPCTLELLKKNRTKAKVSNGKGGYCVLATEREKPLVRYWLEDGKSQRYDVINTAWDRLSKVCKLADKPLKLCRKSSASLLASHELHGRLVTYFLGNAPEGISETHYIAEGSKDALLAKALDWLRLQYGL